MSAITDLTNGSVTTRSYQLVISAGIGFADFVTTVPLALCTLPIGAIVIDGFASTSTQWDVTTSLMDIGDGALVDRYTGTALDLEAAASGAIVGTGLQLLAATQDITATVTSTGPVAGVGAIVLTYVDTTKSDENYE